MRGRGEAGSEVSRLQAFLSGGLGRCQRPPFVRSDREDLCGMPPLLSKHNLLLPRLGGVGAVGPVSAGLGCGVPGLFLPPKRMEPTEMGFLRWLRDLLFVD